MAIFHMNVETKTKSRGQSAAASVSYIARVGKYKRGDELVHLQSGNMPSWGRTVRHASCSPRRSDAAEAYWAAADLYERSNARLCKEVECSLPRELTLEQSVAAVQEFVFYVTGDVDGGALPFTFGVHRGKGKNPHAHLMVSERVNDGIARSPGSWFRRAGPDGGARKTEKLKGADWLLGVRKLWADVCNTHLKMHGHEARIDHRSFVDQGIEGIPGEHIGVAGVAVQRKRRKAKRLGEQVESAPDRIMRHKKLKKAKTRVAEIEQELEDLESEKAKITGTGTGTGTGEVK